jgi:hypothetical protein
VGPVVGIGGLVAAGIIWRLGRRRREQTLNRETGCDIPTTPAPIEAVARQARAIADHEALRSVTIGETAAGTVLANLEHAGSLAIEGDPERQRDLLLQILVEMTSQPWTDQALSGVHVLGDAGLDTALQGVDVDDDLMFMALVLDQLSDRYQRDIGDVASVVVRRAMDSGWEPRVAVAFVDAPAGALRCVIESAVPDAAGWRWWRPARRRAPGGGSTSTPLAWPRSPLARGKSRFRWSYGSIPTPR